MSGYNSRKLKHKLNRNLNNRGFSLVEILIAVAILVLCAVPLLKAFVTSAQTNARAKSTDTVTDDGQVAGDLCEGDDIHCVSFLTYLATL